MSDYLVASLDGLLTRTRSCSELLEAVAPEAETILAESANSLSHLFFATYDGKDGIMKLSHEASERLDKDEQAAKFRWFCAMRGVRACALLVTGRVRGQESSSVHSGQTAEQNAPDSEDKPPTEREQLFPTGECMAFLYGEFLGENRRLCVWKLDPLAGPIRTKEAWDKEMASSGGRFANLLGQGNNIGFPVADEVRDLFVASSQQRAGRQAKVRSFSKGPTPGEVICDTTAEKAWIRLTENQGSIFLVGLLTGDILGKADKTEFITQLSRASS